MMFREAKKTLQDRIAESRQSNAFLLQYPGFKYFESNGIVAYVDTHGCRVGALEPLVSSEEDLKPILEGFAASAKEARKSSVLFPVSESCAKIAQALGWRAIQIGVEPWYELRSMELSALRISVAKRLASRKATVEEFRPEKLDPKEKAQLDSVLDAWLRTRRTSALGFVNQVRPWDFAAEKRYFLVRQGQLIYAFLSAIPVGGRKGWYFVDIPRDPDAPVGAMELLMLEAMRILKEEGSLEISLGVSPLAKLPDPAGTRRLSAERVLSWIYARSDYLPYNFRSLWEFKQKMGPTRLENSYLITDTPRFPARFLPDIFSVFFPDGKWLPMKEGLKRSLLRVDLRAWLEQLMGMDAVSRPFPKKLSAWPGRLPITLALIATLASVHLAVPFSEGEFYTWNRIPSNPLSALVLAGFHHMDDFHLGLNSVTGFFICGLFEVVAGSFNTLLILSLCWVLTNPLTTILVSPFLAFKSEILARFLEEPDRGASLGIFGCIGALTVFFTPRLRRIIFVGLALGSAAVSWRLQSFLILNHVVALVLGRLFIRLRVR